MTSEPLSRSGADHETRSENGDSSTSTGWEGGGGMSHSVVTSTACSAPAPSLTTHAPHTSTLSSQLDTCVSVAHIAQSVRSRGRYLRGRAGSVLVQAPGRNTAREVSPRHHHHQGAQMQIRDLVRRRPEYA